MINNKCPICAGELLQMLSRKVSEGTSREYEPGYNNNSKHFGFWCDDCKQMFKQKWKFIEYG